MRWLLIILGLIISNGLFAQSKIDQVAIEAKTIDGIFYVTEKLHVSLMDTVTVLNLKSINFSGSEISKVIVQVNDDQRLATDLSYELVNNEGLYHIKIGIPDAKLRVIQVSYLVTTKQKEVYLPLFFTDLAAAASENDFFNMLISYPENESFYLHFPAGNLVRSNEISGYETIQFNLPALASVVRLERLASHTSSPFYIKAIDWATALLFIAIGIIIWFYRKKLIYG